jgi:hypothetical protein
LLAAERTGRKGCGLEIDPGYVDVALRRLAQHAGLEALHVESGQTFDEVAASRAQEDSPDEGAPVDPPDARCEGATS